MSWGQGKGLAEERLHTVVVPGDTDVAGLKAAVTPIVKLPAEGRPWMLSGLGRSNGLAHLESITVAELLLIHKGAEMTGGTLASIGLHRDGANAPVVVKRRQARAAPAAPLPDGGRQEPAAAAAAAAAPAPKKAPFKIRRHGHLAEWTGELDRGFAPLGCGVT